MSELNLTNEVRLRAKCSLSFEAEIATPMVFMLRPQNNVNQQITAETFELDPAVPVHEFSDAFGNLCQRLLAPVGRFELVSSIDAIVRQQARPTSSAPFVEVPNLPDSTLVYLLPSRFCESDRFGDMAQEIVVGMSSGYEQVEAIRHWVQSHIRNVPLSSTYPVSSTEVNSRGEGVCRDLAQLAISLCRALCIPARLLVGYLQGLEPMDNHAWFEAFVGGRWYTFDPASDSTGGRIVVARGRDAADVAIYNQYGPLLLPTGMEVSVERAD
ncbi:MAG: transglutaminase-like putative cysteine protease [Alcanivorax sp.]|jgi:transglutaminase-like putative cysteine protease